VLLVGAALVVVQLAFRAWAVYGSWFEFDDFAWMSMSLHRHLGWSFLFQSYAGHLMPGGFLLSWVFAHLDPLNFWLPATALLVLQAVASVGCLRLLRSMFGDRWGILPPLAVYLFSVISLPTFMWWAAGINGLPLQVALFWGVHAHVAYLRTGRLRHALAAMAWTCFGLFFFEKTLYVFLVYGFLALAYFVDGWGVARLADLWRRYRAGVLTYSVTVVAYLALYSVTGLNFDPNKANDYPLGPIAANLVGLAFGSGIVGGPLRWLDRSSFSHTPDPSDLTVLLAWAAIAALVYEVGRTRARSGRAWLLVGLVLLADVMLLAAARAFVVGPGIALEYRYQGELTACVALSLALATMPLEGAHDRVAPKASSNFLDSGRYVLAATAVVAVLSMVSSLQYATRWQSGDAPKRYFAQLDRELGRSSSPADVANSAVPEYVLWGLAFPENQTGRMLAPLYGDKLRFTDSTEHLQVIDSRGRLRPAVIPSTRTIAKGPRPGCGYLIRRTERTIPFNGPVIGGGWWVRVGYLASGSGQMRIRLGSRSFDVSVHPGVHAVFVQADGEFDRVALRSLTPGMSFCTNDVILGMPQPAEPGGATP
jgi:hypothetical protein